jgi:(4S)-4-hydroxy-5-phosphonooxypentane-2,3-dione isomerase
MHQRVLLRREALMYVVVVFFEAKPERLAAFRGALLAQARNSLERERGCRQFDVAQDPLDPASFLLYEAYDSEAAFKAHLETEHFKTFSETVTPWTASKHILTYELISGPGQA